MTRMKIAFENVPTIDGRKILHGGLNWQREPVPVTLDKNGQVVGSADKIRRDPDGTITAEVTAVGIKGLYPQIGCTQSIEDHPNRDDLDALDHLQLRYIAFGSNPVWDELESA